MIIVSEEWGFEYYDEVYKLNTYVMRSMKRDLKSANVNFEIVKYVVDDYLTNIKKKTVDQKVQKWLI